MQNFRLGVLLGAFLWAGATGSASGDLPMDKNIAEDASLTMPQLVTKYGYPVETHIVQTEDGYLLTMYRIPNGRKCGPRDAPKPPVLVQHGLLSSSFDFIIMGPQKSLGYILADNCYDVWLGNNRGNSLSRKHVKLTPNKKEFWMFSWHEMGKYDLPAMIDHILKRTNQSSVHYIGHSQGTTQFFVFGALRPEYQRKVRSMHALSPVVFMKNLASPFVKIAAMFQNSLQTILNMVGIHEFLPGLTFLNLLGSEVCKNEYPGLQGVCCNVLFLLCGFDEPQLNRTILPAIIGHTPAGAATRQFIHYAQGVKTGKFRHFDFGAIRNLKEYKSIAPPDYELTKLNVPIALYYGGNDWMAALKDVAALRKKLPNIVENYHVPYPKFNHLDFIFATDGQQLIYDKLLQVLARL